MEAFKNNLAAGGSWLEPFNGFGPDNFLVGVPDFDFSDYQDWVRKRFAPRHFQKLKEKMDFPAQYAIGSFIQALGQNEGLEAELQRLGGKTHVYVGTGVGALDTNYKASIALYEAQRRWNRFWSNPVRNSAVREFLAKPAAERTGAPPLPESGDADTDDELRAAWCSYWAERSPELDEYLRELAEIDSLDIEGEVATGKLHLIREKEKRRGKLEEKWGVPEPPWNVTADIIWNIHNAPAAQISILGKITGLTFAPVGACSTFGLALRLAMRAIQCGDAKAVVVGAADPPPHPLLVGAFYSARVISADRAVSIPLTRLHGTHVAGGSIVWIVGDLDHMISKGFKPLGMEPLSVGVSSDANHIITPSLEGPKIAMLQALEEAHAETKDLGNWDLHATATPGDYTEIATLRSVVDRPLLVTARKGTFGHGMSAGGGWELTAQYLGYEQGQLFPTPLSKDDLNSSISSIHDGFVFDSPCELPVGLAGKLSMGIGGINTCVVSGPLN